MKTTLSYLLLLPFFIFASCSNDNNEDENNSLRLKESLPEKAQAFLASYAPNILLSEVELSIDKSTYTTYYKNTALEIVFDNNGNWLTAKNKKGKVSDTLLKCLPEKMQMDAETLLPTDTIKSIEVKQYGYMYLIKKGRLWQTYTRKAYDKTGTYLGSDITATTNRPSDGISNFIHKYWGDTKTNIYIVDGDNLNTEDWILYLENNDIVRLNSSGSKWIKIDGQEKALSKKILTLIPQRILEIVKTQESPVTSIAIETNNTYTIKHLDGKIYSYE